MQGDELLLKHAALAGGYAAEHATNGSPLGMFHLLPAHYGWQAMQYDMDAFRLATKLRMHIGLESHAVTVWHPSYPGSFRSEPIRHADDENRATRRAIVRCAAYLWEVRRGPVE